MYDLSSDDELEPVPKKTKQSTSVIVEISSEDEPEDVSISEPVSPGEEKNVFELFLSYESKKLH